MYQESAIKHSYKTEYHFTAKHTSLGIELEILTSNFSARPMSLYGLSYRITRRERLLHESAQNASGHLEMTPLVLVYERVPSTNAEKKTYAIYCTMERRGMLTQHAT